MANRVYKVYVIEAITPLGNRVYYVGQTALPLRKRFEQHYLGKQFCNTCKRRWYIPKGSKLRLRRDLSEELEFGSREEAEGAEKEIAKSLRRAGLKVKGGR